MSDRRSKQVTAVKFEPVTERENVRVSGEWMLAFGVAFPAAIIAVELAGHLCAQTFFDPLPTWWHALAATMVPAGNLWIWYHLQNGGFGPPKWLAFANGVAIAIAGFYAFLFLPLLPLAIVGIFVLIGLMPLAPLVSFVCALKLRALFSARHANEACRGALIAGLATGLGLLVIIDIPSAATRLGIGWAGSSVPSERERGLAWLRRFGDEDLLLRLSYGSPVRPGGLLSALAAWSDNDWLVGRRRPFAQNTSEMREIYYRVYGVPFNAKPPPADKTQSSVRSEFVFDDDHGGTQVGGRLNGLNLISSKIDGSINGDDAVAYLEWTIEFRNSAPLDREVRLQLALPPGAVVSRATLWVNGEEREAAYGGRGEVRAAYARVAVQQRRDPLLVTTKGAGRVLAQAFPVPRGGGTIKFKLGISAPLDIVDPARASLTLPALVDRNFSFAADASHHVWIESRQPLTGMPLAHASREIITALEAIPPSVSETFLPPIARAGIAALATLFCFYFAAFRERPPLALCGLTALALPVLPSLQFTLGYPMRIISAALAVPLLQAHGLDVARQGTFLLWRDEMIQFDAPCSGVNMLWTGLLLTLVGCVLLRLHPVKVMVAMALSLLLAIACNVLRASSLFYIEAHLIAQAPAWWHKGIGIAAFAVTAVVTLRLLIVLRHWEPKRWLA